MKNCDHFLRALWLPLLFSFSQSADCQFIGPHVIEKDLVSQQDVTAADFDGDGDNDIITAFITDDRIAWYVNQGDTAFAPQQVLVPFATEPFFVKTADIDKDGDSDLLVYFSDEHTIYWYSNDGTGQVGPPQIASGSVEHFFSVVDMDADGYPDLLFHDPGGFLNYLFWSRNKGDGTFGPSTLLQDPIFHDANYELPMPIDYEQDGDVDFIIQSLSSDLYLHLNDGNANFTSQVLVNDVPFYGNIIPADLDGDADFDIILFSPGQLAWYLNKGAEGFELQPNFVSPASNFWMKIIDFDNDGDMDIHIDNAVPVGIEWWRNDGIANFEWAASLNTNISYANLYVDADGDTDKDLLYFDPYELGWYENLTGSPTISGFCYRDENQNGQKDSVEAVLRGIPVKIETLGTVSYSDAQGRYRFFAPQGDYILRAGDRDCWAVFPDTFYHKVAAGDFPAHNLDFGFVQTPAPQKIITGIISPSSRCFGTTPFWVTVENRSCDSVEGRFCIVLDSLTTYETADPLPDSIAGDTIWWNIKLMAPTALRSVYFIGELAGADYIGDTVRLRSYTFIQTAPGPWIAVDTSVYQSIITCSFDPNDKLVDPEAIPYDYEAAETELRYTIRFQNTGNDTAFSVVIRDTLDYWLDWSTLRPIGSSHPHYIEFEEFSGIAMFHFDDINLPDSTTNATGSQGFISFSARPLPGLAPGDSIRNGAGIYFDKNPPIITNFVKTVVSQPVGTTNENADDQFSVLISPNPATGQLRIVWLEPAAGNLWVRLTDMYGRVVHSGLAASGQNEYVCPLGALPLGVYMVGLHNGEKQLWRGKVVKQ